MAGTANRLLENATLVDDLVGPVPEVIRHDPQMRTLPCLNLVLVVPDVLGFAGPQLSLRLLLAEGLEAPVDRAADDRVDVARRPLRLSRPLGLRELDRVEPFADLGRRLAGGDPFEDLADDHRLLLVDDVEERALGGLGLRRRQGRPTLVPDHRVPDGGTTGPQAVVGSLDPLSGVEVRPGVLHLAHVQTIGPVVVSRVDVVRRADHAHVGVHRRLEEFARLRVVAVEPARFLGDDKVPSLGLDAGPDLIDPRAVGDLAADLGLDNDVDLDLLRLPALRQVRLQERPARGHLVVDARLTLLLRGEPGVDQGAERLLLREQDRLAEVHHDAPPFAAAGGTIAIPRAATEARAERPTLSGMTLKNFAETLLKGPDFDRNEPLRSNASQRSQVVDGHGHCVRNRRNSETVENSLE